MITMHTSPLATPGVGDAGGLNVYVAEVARRLGERGIKVDGFTRGEDDGPGRGEVNDHTRAEDDGPELVEVNERTRVVQLEVGPRAVVAKEELPDLVPAFAAAVSDR